MTVREQQKGGEGRCPSPPFVLLFLKSDAEDLPKLIVFSVGHHGGVPRAEHEAGAAVRCFQHRDGAAIVKGDGEPGGEPAGGRAAEGPGVGEHLLQGGQVGLGGGVRCGEICGAVTGAVMAIGLCQPFADSEDNAAKVNIAVKTKAFTERFKQQFGCIRCIDLKVAGRPCGELIAWCSKAAEEVIQEKA